MVDYPAPATRRLRAYAFDPQASVTLSTAVINDAIIELPWEMRWESPIEIGPVNDYVEVIDYDPAAGVFYEPVDLNNPILLAQCGLPPSEGRPQFHQQMVFAVVMRTIRAFERALGRPVLWAGDHAAAKRKGDLELAPVERNFTKRLRIYPHALREANAYYSPQKRALLFGCFRPNTASDEVDASWVFTCLSQDIVAHETAHAILHGMQQRSIEPSNIDALAFHEAFADIVALLQHFQNGAILRQLLSASDGSLRGETLLTGLAQQFGQATGRQGALRYAITLLSRQCAEAGDKAVPPPTAAERLQQTTEAHARGGILVAAVFDAFVTIYERRAADLFELAHVRAGAKHGGAAPLPPVLVDRLAKEAAAAAEQVFRMCVRALDYIPPVDLRFGEYLRAIITADTDLVPDDSLRYRIAFVAAFKRWGISVPGCLSMAPDSLLWEAPKVEDFPKIIELAVGEGLNLADPADALSVRLTDLLSQVQLNVGFSASDHGKYMSGEADAEMPGGVAGYVNYAPSDYRSDSRRGRRNLRDWSMEVVLRNQAVIHDWFNADTKDDADWETLLGMRLTDVGAEAAKVKGSLTRARDPSTGKKAPAFAVDSARIARRIGPGGQELPMLIVQMTQRRRAYFNDAEQEQADRGDYSMIGEFRKTNPDFFFRGGATFHVDLRDGRLLRIIHKRINDKARLAEEVRFRRGDTTGTPVAVAQAAEPFAFMHRGCG